MLVGHRWGITAIHCDITGKTPAYYLPSGEMTAFYSNHHGDRMLEMESSGVPTYEQPYRMAGIRPYDKVAVVDALATRSDDAIFFHAINRSFDNAIDIEIDLSAFRDLSSRGTHHLIEGRLNDQPGEGESPRIAHTSARGITISGPVLKVTLPQRSVSCVEMLLKKVP